jgi:transposase InsO family protein
MPYTSNKHLPKIRQEAARLVRKGWSTRVVARHFGYSQSAVVKWTKKAREIGDHPIATKSSRPKSHPRELERSTIRKIVAKRLEHHRYAEAVHKELLNDGVIVSLSSVKRTLERNYLIKKRSPWKRYHPHQDRPCPQKQGDLVQLDTIHRMVSLKKRLYVFVLIDIYSRWIYAKAYEKMNAATSVRFVKEAQKNASFRFGMLQSDHGPEFGKWFVDRIQKQHRYTRIGKPNDNAHIERMNRTLQEECLDKYPNNVRAINCALKKYLQYYNHERVHGGILFQTPSQLLTK